MKNKAARLIVFAYSEVGYQCLKRLIEWQENIVAVFTHEDSATETLWFQSVFQLATQHHLPVFTPKNVNTDEWIARINALKPDLLFSFYYRNMINPAILACARLGAYNMHGSLLPKYRGRAPINWAVLHGETETGATLHCMVDKPDAGDIVGQASVPIAFTDTAKIVADKVTQAACEVLATHLDTLKAGNAHLTPQNLKAGSYFSGRKPSDGLIDWQQSAIQIYNLIRAVTHPYPGAFTYYEQEQLTLWWAKPIETSEKHSKSGEIINIAPLTVQTGRGALVLLEYEWMNLDRTPKISIHDTFSSEKMAQ